MFRAMKHVFIVNPAAGKSDRTESYRKLIDAAFVPRGLQYELLVSQAPGDCRKLAQQAAASGEEVRLYACGGDGTLNEVVNGVIGCPNAAVTHYPGGSGNDSIKIFDDPAAFTSIERLLSAEEAPFDLIRCNDSYALNVLSIGFDARVGTDIARFKRLPLVTGKGAYVLSIVNVVGSTIARISDDVIYTWAGPEIAVATTKGYTTQVSVLYLLALYLGEKRGCLSREEAAKLTDDLMILPQMVQRAIDLNPQIAQLAERYKDNSSLFFIGRNVDYAVCMEGSLKLKEISYLHSEAYAAGELKHGTIALIEENRLVIAVACYEPLFDKTMSNVKEVKARGARVLGVALEGNRAIYSEADDVILVPRMDNLFVVPAEIVPLQLFAYYVAKANGCAIDKPKNLAKSVTVE